MAAVASGLTEVFAQNRERDDGNPVVSLSYCRHAVKRNAKRLAEMRIGQPESRPGEVTQETPADCSLLLAALKTAAASQLQERPRVAEVLDRIAAQVETACDDLVATLMDEYLFGLESEMFRECWTALSEHERRTIESHIEKAVASTSATDEARRRSTRALRDRDLRLLLNLPRLEAG